MKALVHVGVCSSGAEAFVCTFEQQGRDADFQNVGPPETSRQPSCSICDVIGACYLRHTSLGILWCYIFTSSWLGLPLYNCCLWLSEGGIPLNTLMKETWLNITGGWNSGGCPNLHYWPCSARQQKEGCREERNMAALFSPGHTVWPLPTCQPSGRA